MAVFLAVDIRGGIAEMGSSDARQSNFAYSRPCRHLDIHTGISFRFIPAQSFSKNRQSVSLGYILGWPFCHSGKYNEPVNSAIWIPYELSAFSDDFYYSEIFRH